MSNVAEIDKTDIDPRRYDLTKHDRWKAAKKERNEAHAAFQECLDEIVSLRRELRQLHQNGDTNEESQITDLKDQLTDLQVRANSLQDEYEAAESALYTATEEAKGEVAPAFREQWRNLHAKWIQALRRLHEIDEAITALERIRRRVRNQTPNCRPKDSPRVNDWDPLRPPHPSYKGEIRNAIQSARIERIEQWAERHGYA